MTDANVVLHIGAPKCGSSALQTALSRQPELRGADGRLHRYAWFHPGGPTGDVSGAGRLAATAARASRYGYVSWPDLTRVEPQVFWPPMHDVLRRQHARGAVPILSNEGWIHRAPEFAANLLTDASVRPHVIAFLRPPIEVLNAAYWQWGVWSGLSFPRWLKRHKTVFPAGAGLVAWARTPALARLSVRPAQGDVVATFAELTGLPLTPGLRANPSASPPFIGFLLRNRRFRPTAHDAGIEFVFARWCRLPKRESLWAFRPKDLLAIRDELRVQVAELLGAIDPEDAARLAADPRWTRGREYHDRFTDRARAFDDREALAELHAALAAGVAEAAAAAGTRPPPLPTLPSADAPVEDWDAAIAPALEALIEADAAWRRKAGGMAGRLYRLFGGAARRAG